MAMALATVIATAALTDTRFFLVRPRDIKRLVNADPRSSVPKGAVIKYVIRRHGDKLLPRNAKREHVADAMACIDVFQNYEREHGRY